MRVKSSNELSEWVAGQKDLLYEGDASAIIKELDRLLSLLPGRGSANKNRKKRLQKVREYLNKRLDKMNYKAL